MFFYDESWFKFILPALLLSLIATAKIRSAYSKYSRKYSDLGFTGEQVAKKILQNNNIYDINIVRTQGMLTDYYDSNNKIIALSDGVYGDFSIASIAVAAHESGHAVQLETGYLPLKIRHSLVGITNFATNMSYFLIFLGMIFDQFLINVGIAMFLIIFIFQVVTLPVEFNASRRALNELAAIGASESDLDGAKDMLYAAALTYVAAMVTSLAELLRIISIFGRRDD